MMTLTAAEQKAYFQLNLFLTAATMRLPIADFDTRSQVTVAVYASGALEQAWKDQGIEENPENGERALLVLVNYLTDALKLREEAAESFVTNLRTWHGTDVGRELLSVGARSFDAFMKGNAEASTTLRVYLG